MVNNRPITIFDPLTNAPFPGNVIPTTRINSASAALLQYFPLPTYNTLIQNYRNTTSVPNNNQNIGIRLNAPLTNKDRLNFNVQYQDRNAENEQLFGYRDDATGYGLSASAGWSHSFGRRFNNSANFTFSRNTNSTDPYFAYSTNVAAELGITGTLQTPISYGPPSLSFTNFGSLSDAAPSTNHNQTANFTDNITYVYKRKHNLTFGYLFRRLQNNTTNYQNARGSFSFSGLETSQIVNGQPVSGTGYDFADFLLGLPQSSSVRYGTNSLYFRGWATSAFAQDDFRISRGLSFNFGLRYEYFSPYTELYNRLSNLDLNSTYTAVAVVTPGQTAPYSGKLPSSLVRSQDADFSPRFGFAFRPWAKKATILRGGYSIFYSGSAYAQIASQLASQPPFATTQSSTTSTLLPLTIQNGFVSNPTQNITNTYSIDPNYRIAYAQTWSLAVQNTLPHGYVIETEYIGTKGTHLGVVDQPNRAAPGASVVNAGTQLPIPNASGFTYQTSNANSSFNAAQVRITRRFQRGISAMALYTFSKSLDDASSFSGPGGTTVQFINNLGLERGLSSFNQTHKLSTTFLLSSPVGVHGMLRNGGWKQHTLAGWTLNGTITAATGTPQTATVSGNLSNIGGNAAFGSSRAQATGESINAGNDPYFNLAAFTTPAGRFLRERRAGHDHQPLHFWSQHRAQPGLPLWRYPPDAAIPFERKQRPESRCDHRLRHHGQFLQLRAGHRGQRYTYGFPAPEVQFLMAKSPVILLLIAALCLQGQDSQVVKFSSSSNLVIVDVTVKDKSGKPIGGLKAGDFVVTEDGKPQKISVFEYQKLSSDPEPPPTLTLSDQLKLPDAPKTSYHRRNSRPDPVSRQAPAGVLSRLLLHGNSGAAPRPGGRPAVPRQADQ